MDGPASRRKFAFGIVSLGASRWPPQIVIRYVAAATRHSMVKYQVNIASVGPRTVPLVRAVRVIGSSSLRDAAAIAAHVRSAGQCTLLAGVDRSVAEHAVALLRGAGAIASVEESPVASPMLLQPALTQTYRWSWLFGPTAVRAAT